jgi:hypothetical protein
MLARANVTISDHTSIYMNADLMFFMMHFEKLTVYENQTVLRF